jgi:hypothetical protein
MPSPRHRNPLTKEQKAKHAQRNREYRARKTIENDQTLLHDRESLLTNMDSMRHRIPIHSKRQLAKPNESNSSKRRRTNRTQESSERDSSTQRLANTESERENMEEEEADNQVGDEDHEADNQVRDEDEEVDDQVEDEDNGIENLAEK